MSELKTGLFVAGFVSVAMASGNAEAEQRPTPPPAQTAPPQSPVTTDSDAQPPTMPPGEDATPPAAPEPAETVKEPSAAPPSDDGLQVPATLAPLSADTTTVAVAHEPPMPPLRFGQKGEWVMMGDSNGFGIHNETLSNSAATYFDVGGEIGIDNFVAENLSIGFDVSASYGDDKAYGAALLTETTSRAFSAGVRFGLNVPLGELFSWYPRMTLSLGSAHSTVTPISSSDGSPLPPASSESTVGPLINLYAPLLVQPAPHLVVGFGPRLHHDFAVIRGGAYDGSQATSFSGDFVVGGWWGGAERAGADQAEPADAEKAAHPAFGEEGQLVLTFATDASLSYSSYSRARGSETTVDFEPSIDYFVEDAVSIGVDAFIAHSTGTALDSSGFETQFSSTSRGIAPRLGANIALTDFVSLWLRGEIGIGTLDQTVASAEGTNQHSRTRTWLDFSAPFLLHPSTHFFVGAGPFFFHELSDKDQYDFQNTETNIGVSLLLGGWFGASAARTR